MSLAGLLRDLRRARGWSQTDLATRLCAVSGRPCLTREDVSRWERGKVIPGPHWTAYLAKVLGAPAEVLTEEARLSRVNRRTFLNLAALTAVHGGLAAEFAAGIAAGDAGLLSSVQTTHETDLVMATMVDRASMLRLDRWMAAGADPVLRVNAAGILAKVPGQEPARRVAAVLSDDEEAQQLCMTAVLARVCLLDWAAAARLAARPQALRASKTGFVAMRLSREVLNPADAGARWCSATILREISPLLR